MLVVSLTTTTNTWPIHATMCFSSSPARPVTQTVWQYAQASESANLGKTCKYGIAAAADAADATAAFIATDADDTADVAASTAGLSLLQCNNCFGAL